MKTILLLAVLFWMIILTPSLGISQQIDVLIKGVDDGVKTNFGLKWSRDTDNQSSARPYHQTVIQALSL